MALMRHRLLLLCAPILTSPGCRVHQLSRPQRLDDSWHMSSVVCQDIENKSCSDKDTLSLQRQCLMSQRTVPRRHQAIDTYLADDKIEEIRRQLACSKSWLYTWRNRYDARQCCLGPRTPEKTQEPPDAHARTCRTSRRVLAPDVASQRHRRWRHRHYAGARPTRY